MLQGAAMAETLGMRRGWHHAEKTFAILAVHTFFFLSPAQTPTATCRLFRAGCTKSCWQGSGLSFSSNRHDSVTLFWLGGLSFSVTIFHLSPQPPRK